MSLLSSPTKPALEPVAASPVVDENEAARLSWLDRSLRALVLRRLKRLQHGGLTLREPGVAICLGPEEPSAEILVRQPRFYRRVALGGALGAADAYIDGDWDAPDLTATLRVLARNAAALQEVERGVPRVLRPVRSAVNRFRRNTAHGSRRNIAAHYDLSNEFFTLMLDPTMTYSSGVFPSEEATLEQASVEKYDRLCRKLRIGPEHHVLEIGTGWGGFAEHAARHYGCRVTTTTISEHQHDYAKQRFEQAGVADRIELLKSDYRDLRGQFDRVVSIEMIEAVGEEFLPGYFRQCSSLLKPDGAMGLQAITIPDCRYERYRRSVDFIQRYIFPGGFLPSPGAITACLAEQTDLRVMQLEDFSDHYARTLREWRDQLWSNMPRVRELGFDERFLRTWQYYLCYCEAGFRERQVGVSQWVFTKPLNRDVNGVPAA